MKELGEVDNSGCVSKTTSSGLGKQLDLEGGERKRIKGNSDFLA